MYTDGGLKPYDYVRICDVCGVRWHKSDLTYIGEFRWACPDDAKGLTAMQIAKYNAKARPLRIRPNKWAKGLAGTPVYQMDEAAVFNYLAATAPNQNIATPVASARATAWAALYMAEVIIDGRRPQNWISRATTLLASYLAYLDSVQSIADVTDPRYGGLLEASGYATDTVIAGGLAYLRGYQALGTPGYLTAAKRCATYLRHVQSGDVQVTSYTVFPQGGGPYHVGGVASGVGLVSGLLTNNYLVADVAALWFLKALQIEIGDATFGDAAATAYFGVNAAPLSTMIAELQAFARTGAKDSTESGAYVTGLSTTAPRTTYIAARNGEADPGTWTPLTLIGSDPICLALRGLYEADPADATVTAMMAWLAAFTSNAANATPVQRESLTFLGTTGTYDPAICPADTLKAAAPFTEASGALYSWASLGLLSPILSAANLGTFRVSKDALAKPRQERFGVPDVKYMGVFGKSGLGYQVYGMQDDVVRASKAALCYRQPPGHYPQVNI